MVRGVEAYIHIVVCETLELDSVLSYHVSLVTAWDAHLFLHTTAAVNAPLVTNIDSSNPGEDGVRTLFCCRSIPTSRKKYGPGKKHGLGSDRYKMFRQAHLFLKHSFADLVQVLACM